MVGDIVTFKDCQNDKEKVVVKIWQINQEGNALVFIDDSEALDEIAIDDEIVGIPLTPEILEKNGFYHEKNVGYIDDDYNGRQIIYDFWNHNLKILDNYNTMFDIVGWSDHIHVHELQHALRLCGIEKTIEL
jgi:hypothetical protein